MQCGRWRRLEACDLGICDNCDDEDSEYDEYIEYDDADVYDENNEYGDVYDEYDEDYNSNRDSVFTTGLYNDDDVYNSSHDHSVWDRAARS